MILVTIGTQKQSFKRLFDYIDELDTDEEIIVQGGIAKYNFKKENVKLYDYFSYEEMNKYIKKARVIIAHGGGGTIFKALELGKKIIIVPRLKKYGEHINDHQLEVTNYLLEKNYAMKALNKSQLIKCLKEIDNYKFDEYSNNHKQFVKDIKKEIDLLINEGDK